MPDTGNIVVLNGVPRSGKSTIARAIQESSPGMWLSLGVDAFADYVTPTQFRPGIGLRPGGERPDLEQHLPLLFDALYKSVIALSRLGPDIVVDVGHHDDYSKPLGILRHVATELADLPAYFVGVRCPVDVIMERRDAGGPGQENAYVGSGRGGAIPEIPLRWERAVHDPGIYDLEVNTSVQSPMKCVSAIMDRLNHGQPSAFSALAGATH